MKLQRVVMEVFGGCNYTCAMCPQSNPGRGHNFTKKMKIDEFIKILDQITPKYGKPQINLEGSGEPTMAKDLDQYVKAVKSRGLKCFMYCNGARLNGDFMKRVIDSGIDFIRISIIGYNREEYKKWMNVDNFELIKKNIKEIQEYIKFSSSSCKLSTYHLITNNEELEMQLSGYINNVIQPLNTISYIWKMHNWSGNFDNKANKRLEKNKRSCGRPFAPELTVRAGGAPGKSGAVVPCCQTLGPPNEEKSILGHLSEDNIEKIWNGEPYKKLREAHKKNEFEKIDYCKNCDFLYDDPEVLVWSNDKKAKVNHMLGTPEDFILTDDKYKM
jgi:radical SAM protein with 4Fe4S-binding SPASM domain